MEKVEINEISQGLLDNTDDQLKPYLVDFCNQFLKTFPNMINKDELLNRLNKIKKVDFGAISSDGDTNYNDMAVTIHDKFKNDPERCKSVVYHELIHVVSIHDEKNLDYGEKNEMFHAGLYRGDAFVTDEYFITENQILDEIMTEYYNTKLLEHEGIKLGGEHMLCSYGFFGKDYVEYKGTGYFSLAGLGQIYDYLFGDYLMQAKLFDANKFRTYFNETFKDIDYNIDAEALPYSKFVNEEGAFERYETAIKMYGRILETEIVKDRFDINEFVSRNIEFQSMLPKREELGEIRVNDQIYDKFMEEEKRVLLNNIKYDDELNVSEEVMFSVYEVIKELKSNNPDFPLDNLSFNSFNDNNYSGVIVSINDVQYLSSIDNSKTQNRTTAQFQPLPEEAAVLYSNEFNIDVENPLFARDYSSTYSLIKNGNDYYNRFGEKVQIGPTVEFLTGRICNNLVEEVETIEYKTR